jgi:hypothetical protein
VFLEQNQRLARFVADRTASPRKTAKLLQGILVLEAQRLWNVTSVRRWLRYGWPAEATRDCSDDKQESRCGHSCKLHGVSLPVPAVCFVAGEDTLD